MATKNGRADPLGPHRFQPAAPGPVPGVNNTGTTCEGSNRSASSTCAGRGNEVTVPVMVFTRDLRLADNPALAAAAQAAGAAPFRWWGRRPQ